MPSANANVGGNWQPLQQIWAMVSGVWQPVQLGYVNVGGAWELFFQAFSGVTYTFTPSAPGSGNVTVPIGAHSISAYVVGAGGSGYLKASGNYGGGGGGGAGAGIVNTSLTSADWGEVLSFSVGANVADAAGGNSSLSGTLSDGAFWISATGGAWGGTAGQAGGIATGSGGGNSTIDLCNGTAGFSGGSGTGGQGEGRFGDGGNVPGTPGV